MQESIYFVIIIIAAWLLSSFLNVLIHRLPIMLELSPKTSPNFKYFNLFLPRSHCPKCAKTIAWYYNIPILSFLYLRGKCAYCKTKISLRYPLVEILYTFCVSMLYLRYSISVPFFASAWFTGIILVQAIIDLEIMIIPDILNYLLLWSGLLVNSFSVFCSLNEAVYGAMIAYLSLWGFYHIFLQLTGKKGFGYGDFKLYASIGAWIGLQHIFSCIMLSCIFGIVIGILAAIKMSKKLHHIIIPFGPSLALAGYLIILFYNNQFSFLLGS